MAEVDPDDDTIERHVVFWYRYDAGRNERRHCVVAAYDNETEMCLRMDAEHAVLQERQASAASEDVEHISGSVKVPGYTAARNIERLGKRLRRRSDVAWLNYAPDRPLRNPR